jgi:4-hydroxy-3-methylbut-2-enyl diphosphate reductase
VIRVQRLSRVFFKRGYKIVLIGDKGHKEVEGINAWGEGSAHIVSNQKDLEEIEFSKDEKIAVLSQTTQSEEFFKKASSFLEDKFSEAEVLPTICHTTHDRQAEIRKKAKESDVVIIIGSETSANSKRLYEIALAMNPKSYFIENAQGIRKSWFLKANKIMITAGASTPSWVIEDVVAKLNTI